MKRPFCGFSRCPPCLPGKALAWELRKLCPDCRVDGVDLGADFVTHGSTKELYRHYGLDGESIANYTQGVLS